MNKNQRWHRGSLALLVLATGLSPLSFASAVTQTTPNLLINGNAELQNYCTSDWTAQSTIVGWHVLRGAASTLCYSAFSYANETPVLPPNGTAGNALFGSPGADTAMDQDVDVSAVASAIDSGTVKYALSGWLGGHGSSEERATLTAVFLDDSGQATGSPVVLAGPDASARNNVTALVQSEADGIVPPLTRKIVVTVDFLSSMISYHNAYADNLSLTLSGNVSPLSAATAQVAQPPVSNIPPLDHIYVVMMENTNYADVVHTNGNTLTIDSSMPYLSSLAKNGVILTNYWAEYHPSDQNYVAMVAGDTFELGPVYFPNYNLKVSALNNLLDAKGLSWRSYGQNMQTPCNLTLATYDSIYDDASWYEPDQEPFVQFADVIADATTPNGYCQTHLRDLKDFESAITNQSSLPKFAWISADGWWDGEGAWYINQSVAYSQASQDSFLQTTLQPLLQSAQWKNSRSLLIITWDEGNGWGWPNSHVPTFAVGSPGLLKAGSVVNNHYDHYSVLRTIESAFNLGNLGRFDEFAKPLNAIFANNDDYGNHDLRPTESLATVGTILESFGKAASPAAVTVGQPIKLLAPTNLNSNAGVSVAALGEVPDPSAVVYNFDSNGTVSIPSTGLSPGVYGAWLRQGNAPPYRAPLMINVLPTSSLTAAQPGIEIIGNPAGSVAQVREGGNVYINYCRSSNATPANTWIGIFPENTASDKLTQANAVLVAGYEVVLAAPGATSSNPCGQAQAYTSELKPGKKYEILLLLINSQNPSGPSTVIGQSASFKVSPSALPGS